MAAGLGFKTFTTGEVLTAADTNGYLMQGILVFASSAARAVAITSPQEGQYSYLKDTNALEYYDGAAWVGAPVGDITAVTAGKGLTGGGSSGDVTVSLATTAKGDLVAGSGASTAAVLTVGNNGETLVADSSTSTGLRYQGTQSAAKNGTINGGFDIWQRGTSFAASAAEYTADRWQKWTGSTNFTVSRQASGLTGILYCARFQRNAGATTTGTIDYWTSFESQDSYRFAGQTVTLSFYARAGANYSPTSNSLQARLFTGTGTDQNLQVGGFTGASAVINQTPTLTTSWQRFSYTGSVGSTATQVAIDFSYVPTGTAGAADYYEVTGVQLEIGSVATNFLRTGGTIQGELAACQRYYVRFGGDAVDQIIGTFGMAYATTAASIAVPLPVKMRVIPSSVDYSTIALSDITNAVVSVAAMSLSGTTTPSVAALTPSVASGLTQYRPYRLQTNNSTSGYVAFNAEL